MDPSQLMTRMARFLVGDYPVKPRFDTYLGGEPVRSLRVWCLEAKMKGEGGTRRDCASGVVNRGPRANRKSAPKARLTHGAPWARGMLRTKALRVSCEQKR